MFQGNKEVGFGFSVMLIAYGLLSALASYGLISLIADIKEAGTIVGVWNIAKNKTLSLFKNNAS